LNSLADREGAGGRQSGARGLLCGLALFAACSEVLPAVRGQSDAQTTPALDRLVRTRDWRKARIEYFVTRPAAPGARYYTGIVCGSDVLVTDRGDEEGAIMRRADGTVPSCGYGPFHTLSVDGQVWHYGEGQLIATLWESEGRMVSFDARTLGLSPQPTAGGLKEILALAGPEARIRAAREGELEVLRAESESAVVEWRLDPRRGGAPVSVRLESGGRIIAESRSEPREFDGVWYPARVEYFGPGGEGGHELLETIEVTTVEVEPRDLPERLTPEFIGIDAGVNVFRRRMSASADVGSEPLKWDGSRVVTLSEYTRAEEAGKVRDGPIYRKNLERAAAIEAEQAPLPTAVSATGKRAPAASAPAASLLERLTGWEAYTQGFIERHRLDGEQTQRAISALRECQELAQAHLASVSNALEQWERVGGRVPTTTQPASSSTEMGRLHREIFGRLDEIFASQLRPRLEAIPTRAQRRSASAP
jgi:hypothetical protein